MTAIADGTVAGVNSETLAGSLAPGTHFGTRAALIVALCAGTAAAALMTFLTHSQIFNHLRPDIDQIWFGARMSFTGRDPYPLVGPGKAFDWKWGLTYPASAFVLAAPLAALPLDVARALFVALGVGLLAYALARHRPQLLPILGSFPVYYAVERGQWSPYLGASLFLPLVGVVFSAKPTIAAAMWITRPTRVAILAGIIVIAASFALLPHWVPEFLAATKTSEYTSLIREPGGFLILAALYRWRRPEARMLTALALIPQSPFAYESIYPMLVANTRTQALAFTIASWAVYIADCTYLQGASYSRSVSGHALLSIVIFYLPATILVLRRPNVSSELSAA